MNDNLQQLAAELLNSTSSTDVLDKIGNILKEQTSQSIVSFVIKSLQSLITIEHWAWQMLSQDFRQWTDQPNYSELFHILYSFNTKLISNHDEIHFDTVASLLIPSNNEWIDGILNQIESNNDTFLTIASLWFDILSHFAFEHAEIVYSPIIIHLNDRLSREFLMTNQYKSYLKRLQQANCSQSMFSIKQLFYLKTCSFSINIYLSSNLQQFPFTSEEILKFLADDYLQMILVQSYTLDSWSNDLLSCIAHIIGLICSICWRGGEKDKRIEMLAPSEDTTHTHILALICIVNHKSFHRCLSISWYTDENLLIDAILIFLFGAVEAQDLRSFISAKSNLTSCLLTIAQSSSYDRITMCAYGLLAEILSDEQLKELKIADNICEFFFHIVEQAWRNPTKKWKKIPIPYLLKGFFSLAKNDTIQTTTVKSNKIPLFIELCGTYPMVFDIIWALSFNSSIQEQIRSNQPFMAKLAKVNDYSSDDNVRKAVYGILWNLNCAENAISEKSNDKIFDIMISYSHKDKQICKQLYDELIRVGYKIWIDFDQMHGNVIDAMAQAIEQSHMIIICMSEHYRRSNFCRAEAQYAFQRQLKMVPILLQQHYKPDGWLLFLIGQLLYIDFTKHEFSNAMEMLRKELNVVDSRVKSPVRRLELKQHSVELGIISTIEKQPPLGSTILPENIREWTTSQVHMWLEKNNLSQMARILCDVDGLSLIYLSEFIISSDPQQILSSFQQDSNRRTHEVVSIVEVSLFRALIEREGLANLACPKLSKKVNNNPVISNNSKCCHIM